MKPHTLPSPFALALCAAAAFALTSCSHDHRQMTATTQKGVPGGTFVETYTLNSTVSALDLSNRRLTLSDPEGRKTTVKCGPEVINFDQLQVGDRVQATVLAELAVAMATAATPSAPSSTSVATTEVERGVPVGMMAETQQYTARITAIDTQRRRVTLLFPDASKRMFTIRKDVRLADREVGEDVSIHVTVSVAIAVEKR